MSMRTVQIFEEMKSKRVNGTFEELYSKGAESVPKGARQASFI